MGEIGFAGKIPLLTRAPTPSYMLKFYYITPLIDIGGLPIICRGQNHLIDKHTIHNKHKSKMINEYER